MPKKKVVEQQKSSSQISQCFSSHHFVQVQAPAPYRGPIGSIGGGHFPSGDKHRNPRLYCMQCGQTIELSE
jgi:hypothetical protein